MTVARSVSKHSSRTSPHGRGSIGRILKLGSILAAILLHFMHNSTQNLLAPTSGRTFLLSTALLASATIGGVVGRGPKMLTRQQG